MNRFSKNNFIFPALVFLISFIAFSLACAPRVTVEDSGDFLMGLSSLGIVHGPSFPLYTILGHLFSKLPIGEIGFRISLMSAFFGALSLGLFAHLLKLLNVSFLGSLISLLCLFATTVFMGQSVIAEVYTLNTFFILGLYIATLMANKSGEKKFFFAMGLFTGSGLIHHYPLFLVSCTGLIFIFDWKKLKSLNLLFALLGLVIGLLPFSYLIIQMNNPALEYNFGKVTNFKMLWKQFMREGYRGVDEAGGTLIDKLSLCWFVIKLTIKEFGMFIIVMPFSIFSLKNIKANRAVALSALTSSFLIIFLLGFTSAEHHQAVIKAYLLPFFIFISFFIGCGADHLIKKYSIPSKISHFLLALFLGLQLFTNLEDARHDNDQFIYLWAKSTLESLEPNSILILCGQEPYALYYVNKFLKIRPDVTIYDRLSIMTKENLYSPHLLFWGVKSKKAFEVTRKQKELALFQASKRPIYLTCKDDFNDYGYPLATSPYYQRVLNHVPYHPTLKSKALDPELIEALKNGYPKNEYWLDSARNMVVFNTFSYYLNNSFNLLKVFLEDVKELKNYKDSDFLHAMIEETYKHKRFKELEFLAQWVNLKNLNTHSLSRFCTYYGGKKEYKKGLDYCLMALESAKDCDTPLYNNLMFLTYNLGQVSKAKDWALRVLACKPDHPGAKSLMKSIK